MSVLKNKSYLKSNLPSEDQIQMYVAMMAHRHNLLFHGDTNGTNKGRLQGNRAKLMGARSGWPDLCFILPNRITYVELKRENGVVSPSQKAVHKSMASLNCECHVVYANDGPNAWDQITGILGLAGKNL